MGISDGQPINAATTNPAFLDANNDDTALGKISFNNISDPSVSGTQLINAQREFNAIATYTGKVTNTAITTVPAWTNNQIGTSSDSLFQRINAVTGRFDGSSGHAHTGVNGDGPLLTGASLTDIPFRGFYNQGVGLTGVTGGSTDVSTELTGKTPSTGQTELGVVTNTPYNRTILRQGSGPNQGDKFEDGSGNEVYGRVTFSAGVWTLTYFVDIGGVETPYSFGSSVDVDWYYQELYNPVVSAPIYDPMAFTPSDNTTADVVDATTTVAGKVLLSNTSPPAIADTSALGSSSRVARQDHTHEGVHSVLVYGDPTIGLGDVSLEAGSGVTITWASGRIRFASTSANTRRVERRVVSSGEATAKSLTLANVPIDPAAVMLWVIGVGLQDNFATGDFQVSGTSLSWSGLGMDNLPIQAGDILWIEYES